MFESKLASGVGKGENGKEEQESLREEAQSMEKARDWIPDR